MRDPGRRLTVLAGTAVMLVGCAGAPTAPVARPAGPPARADVDVTTLQAVADAFDRAQLAQDAAALERLVDPALIFIAGDGTRAGKAAFVAGWTDRAVTFAPVQITERTFTALGPDAGIVTGRALLRGSAGGTAFASDIRFADVFRRTAGTWRAVHIQVTRVPATP